MAVSVHYVHKQLDRAVEDTGFLTPTGDEGYVIANPSEGLTALAFTNPNIPMPKPKRQYDSVEFALDKRFANNWSLRAAYLWSRLYGNYSGLSQSDENGRADPNVGRSYDYPAMMFTGTATRPTARWRRIVRTSSRLRRSTSSTSARPLASTNTCRAVCR